MVAIKARMAELANFAKKKNHAAWMGGAVNGDWLACLQVCLAQSQSSIPVALVMNPGRSTLLPTVTVPNSSISL